MGWLRTLLSALFGELVTGLVDWWREWRARADAVQIGRDETIIDALQKATEHERKLADQALDPPGADDVTRRLHDGTF